jgi:ribose 1,5-bisphosphokinase
MNRRLIYVVGPSGAGKDSVLSWLRQHTPLTAPVHWARRTIDRPNVDLPNAEDHLSVDAETFGRMVTDGEFAMQWDANTHRYGIRSDELKHLSYPSWCVIVNGSRAHLPTAAMTFPALTVLHVTASTEVLRQRLLSRGRESEKAINARLMRTVPISIPAGSNLIEIVNNSTLDDAGADLLKKLRSLNFFS